MTNLSQKWTPREDAVLMRAKNRGVSVQTQMHHLPGRTPQAAVARLSWITSENCALTERKQEAIRNGWCIRKTGDIARALNVPNHIVAREAQRMGLGINDKDETLSTEDRNALSPDKPKGFTPGQVTWALKNRTTAEAQLILGIIGRLIGAPADPVAKGMA